MKLISKKFLLFFVLLTLVAAVIGCGNNNGSKGGKVVMVEDFEQPDIEGVRGYGAAAFRSEDVALRDAFNTELAKLKESGDLLTLLEENGFSEAELPGDQSMKALCGPSFQEGSGGNTLEKIKSEGKVVVGFANEKPYAYQDENGELKGEAISVATAVFKNMGIEEIEGKLVEFGSLIPGLQAGRFDVITAGMYITPDRCEQVVFAEPEYSIGEALGVIEGNPKDLHSYEDIANNPDAKIAVMQGAIEIGYLEQVGVKDDQIVKVPDQAAALNAVQSGRADAVTMTSMSLKSILESAEGK
ncbi:ectoine/hydroxyectoine ABC transporter substrate-binding protein EhuB [Marinicrinis lubricantis]|uniref:Ectoine/hydroxyectoine ABC transporter substrate-binding protein EhuB n=1 Tax=Marinicrinis lubricantis TaxID=2086470 RepID=A0ABW1ILP3_9BACL